MRLGSFVYDQLGNRKSPPNNQIASLGSVTFHRRDNGLNQYQDWTQWAINYETNGNLYQDGWITAAYNALNQPLWIFSWRTIPSGSTLNFGFDPLGRCVKRWEGLDSNPYFNPATYFHYDGWNLLQEGANAWGPERVYMHGNRIDEIVASYNTWTGEFAFHHYDARGHCITLTDRWAGILEQYAYDAFGWPYFYDGTGTSLPDGSSFGNRFLFTGREWLKEVGVYDFRNRHYLPELGRFIQPDPKHFAAGDYNLYRYCHNDPVNKTDPFGLEPMYVSSELYDLGINNAVRALELSNETRLPSLNNGKPFEFRIDTFRNNDTGALRPSEPVMGHKTAMGQASGSPAYDRKTESRAAISLSHPEGLRPRTEEADTAVARDSANGCKNPVPLFVAVPKNGKIEIQVYIPSKDINERKQNIGHGSDVRTILPRR